MYLSSSSSNFQQTLLLLIAGVSNEAPTDAARLAKAAWPANAANSANAASEAWSIFKAPFSYRHISYLLQAQLLI